MDKLCLPTLVVKQNEKCGTLLKECDNLLKNVNHISKNTTSMKRLKSTCSVDCFGSALFR